MSERDWPGPTLGALPDGALADTWDVMWPGRGERMSGEQLGEAADRCARGLLAAGVRPGDVVGMLVPTGTATHVTLFGIWRAGAAVAVLPVRPRLTPERQAGLLSRIVDVARMRHLVVDPGHAEIAAALTAERPGVQVVTPREATAGGGPTPPGVTPDELAVVQFTSGSTGTPKGVMLTHRMVLAGLRGIVVSAALSDLDSIVQWVPFFHDMGLFGHLATLYGGGSAHLFSPLEYVLRPLDVLRYHAECGGTLMTGPNFGWDLLVSAATPELVRGLDLRWWRLAFNGAEPVSADTVRRFTERLAPAGVSPDVMYLVYGSAEVTLAATFPPPGAEPRLLTVDRAALADDGTARVVVDGAAGGRTLVSVGRPVVGLELRIAGGTGLDAGDGVVGEIQVRGEPVCAGYLNDPEATREAFDGPWLRTGDLGFRSDGELFVAGRRTEMIAIDGRNFFPEDVEPIARAVPGVFRDAVVAFADVGPDGEEQLSLAVEAQPANGRTEELAARIRAEVADALGVTAVAVHVVPPRWLPRTSSGKWQRARTRDRLSAEGPAHS